MEEEPDWLPSPVVPHPDSRKESFLFVTLDPETNSRQLYVSSGTETLRLTGTDGDKSDPQWGPLVENETVCTGQLVFFLADDTTQREETRNLKFLCLDPSTLAVIPEGGTERVLAPFPSDAPEDVLSFTLSPAGGTEVVLATSGGDLYTAADPPTLLSRDGIFQNDEDPLLTESGRLLLFTAEIQNGTRQLGAMNRETGKEFQLTALEGYEMAALQRVPNLKDSYVVTLQEMEEKKVSVALLRITDVSDQPFSWCDLLLIFPLPENFSGKTPVVWGGMTDEGNYLEILPELIGEEGHEIAYAKGEISTCSLVSEPVTRLQNVELTESPLTCLEDARNPSLVPRGDRPPALSYFKPDTEREVAVGATLEIGDLIGKPCECTRDEECDDGTPCTDDACRGHACQYVKSADPNCCNSEEECKYGQLCKNHQCVEESEEKSREEKKEEPPEKRKAEPDKEEDKKSCPPSDNPCQQNVYNSTVASCLLQPANNGATCNDGNTCTVNDKCKNGVCKGFLVDCPCQSDADCAQKEDGNLCNGTLYCDKSSAKQFEWVCKVNLKTIISCYSDSATLCAKNSCDPKNGKCFLSLSTDGTPCDDGEYCTKPDQCVSGVCKAGACDFSGPPCQCKNDNDCLKYDDGNSCNGTWYCDIAENKCHVNPATMIACPTAGDSTCSQNLCNPNTGKCETTPSVAGLACDDGNSCTIADACQGGKCVPGKNNCECTVDADCDKKNEGNLCLGQYFCNKTSGVCGLNPATVPDCTQENETACMKNSCDPKTGKCVMIPKSDGFSCDADGQNCTPKDFCKGGECITGEWDYSLSWCGCKDNADCEAKDEDICNGTSYCDKTGGIHQCKDNPATVVKCDISKNTDCKITYCHSKAGKCLTAELNGNVCEDGNPCTQGDLCTAGVCQPGQNACECLMDADCDKLDDQNLCNGVLFCDKSNHKCKINPVTIVTWCSKDTLCDPATGKCKKP